MSRADPFGCLPGGGACPSTKFFFFRTDKSGIDNRRSPVIGLSTSLAGPRRRRRGDGERGALAVHLFFIDIRAGLALAEQVIGKELPEPLVEVGRGVGEGVALAGQD